MWICLTPWEVDVICSIIYYKHDAAITHLPTWFRAKCWSNHGTCLTLHVSWSQYQDSGKTLPRTNNKHCHNSICLKQHEHSTSHSTIPINKNIENDMYILLPCLLFFRKERWHNSYLHKNTSILDKRMIMQISSWWEYQQVRQQIILLNLFDTQK